MRGTTSVTIKSIPGNKTQRYIGEFTRLLLVRFTLIVFSQTASSWFT